MNGDLRDSQLYEDCYRFKEKRSNLRIYSILFALFFVFFAFRSYWVNTFGGVLVDGPSMNQTLRDGEQLIIRYAGSKSAERGDIIVVHVENYPEVQAENAGKREEAKLKYLIKRLIATEGDTVYCTEGQIYIKYQGTSEFVALEEPYAHYATESAKKSYTFAEYVVGEGEVFFLGDNRLHSVDSRYQERNGSHLPDRLYKAADIFGVVPAWAVKYQNILQKIFF